MVVEGSLLLAEFAFFIHDSGREHDVYVIVFIVCFIIMVMWCMDACIDNDIVFFHKVTAKVINDFYLHTNNLFYDSYHHTYRDIKT